jgi:ribosomal-protein-alanine N-acetyltransferase
MYSMKSIHIRLLKSDDWQPLLAFELRNRSWFEQHIEPRGEAFYSPPGIQQHIASYLADHAAGRWFPGLLLDDCGVIIGRANLKDMDVQLGVAELGYRVAQDQVGRGVATAAVTQMKDIAQQHWGLTTLRAVVIVGNTASIRVLEKNGFVIQGEAQHAPEHWSGKQLATYQCVLGARAG